MNIIKQHQILSDLQHLPLLQVLSPESRVAFLGAVGIAQYPRYDCLFQPGQTVKVGYFILQGAVRQYYLQDGKEVVTRLLLEGDLCTAFYSFLSEKPCYEYGELVEDSVLAVLSHHDVERLCSQHLEIANFERKITEQYLIQEHERAISLQFHSVQERYEHLMNTRPDVFLRFSLGSIASYLGMSQETLSRLRAKKIR